MKKATAIVAWHRSAMVSSMHGTSAGEWIGHEISSFQDKHGSGHWWCTDLEGFFIQLLELVIPHHNADRGVQMLCNMLDNQVEQCLQCLAAHHAAQVGNHNLGPSTLDSHPGSA